MAYSTSSARAQMLDDIAAAADGLALALANLTEGYEALDEEGADALETRIFRPVQAAYGRLRRAHSEFADRYRLPQRSFTTVSPGTHSNDPRVFIERAVQAATEAEQGLADLQDSMLPVDVGDPEVRAALAETRSLLATVPAEGRRLLRSFGR